jgi:hypothetical protein
MNNQLKKLAKLDYENVFLTKFINEMTALIDKRHNDIIEPIERGSFLISKSSHFNLRLFINH